MLEHPFRMPSIDEIERLLKLVKSSLTIQPRNAYEAQNNYTHNLERLEEAKKLLRSFSGDYVNGLQQQLIELDGQLTQAVAKASQPRGNDAFDLNFDAEGLENEVDEFERAEAELVATTADKKKKKQDKSTRVRSEKASRKAKEELEAKLAEEAVMNSVEPASLPCEEETTPPPASYVVLSNELKCKGTDIPALAVSRGRCGLVENSPLAYIILDEEVEWDGERCQCRVDLYRAVLYTLAQSKEPQPLEMKTSQVPSHDDPEEEDEEEDGAELGSGVTEHSPTQALSEQLVDEYDAAQAEAEERDAAGEFPVEIAPQVCARLRQFTTATWVILLCHGGYFAGGVFTNGVPVVHKSMQRYVVRKKQGGKQSSHAKDGGGSYSSAGSLIRASQELKWKIDVRDILRAWTPYIEAAQFILFAAPGPQNRSVLTDFSQLPASTDGPRTPSPILLKDPRVRRVPLTTHRPSFEEVQRIYGTVSTCSISYVREVPQCG